MSFGMEIHGVSPRELRSIRAAGAVLYGRSVTAAAVEFMWAADEKRDPVHLAILPIQQYVKEWLRAVAHDPAALTPN